MTRLLGRYELIRPLARGGMAEVYLALRRGAAGVEKRLVIKRIRPEHAGEERRLELFVREARLSVALTHQNIVPVFDFGRVGNELFLAMEHVDGRDLGSTLQRAAARGRRLDPVLVAYVGAEACAALDYAHRKRDEAGRPYGIVHRDVAPGNVLLSFAGEVKLVDFGVAAVAAGDDRGRLRGTPAYMSPEQARGEAVDGRSDLFALGLVLWEALSGRRAYAVGDAAAAVALARAGVVPPLDDNVPADLRAIVARATQPDPARRFADAREMQRALDAFVVTARAADPQAGAPSHRLAAELVDLFGDALAEGSDPGVVPPIPDGPVATFVDDGPDEVARRSAASTVAEESPPESPRAPPRAPRRVAPIAALAAAAVAAAVVVFVATRDAPAPRAADDARPPAVTTASPPAPAATTATPPESSPASPSSPAAAPMPGARPAPPESIAVATTQAPAPGEPRPAHAKERPAKAQPVETRDVVITSKPWSWVSIDGERERHQTVHRTRLTLGEHTVRFQSDYLGVSKVLVIKVTADGKNEFVETLP